MFDDKALVEKIETALKAVDDEAKENPLTEKKKQTRMELLRVKVGKQAEITKNKSRLEYINSIMEKAKEATIRVEHEIFQGSVISINGQKTTVEQRQDGVEFVENEKRLRMYSLAAMEAGGVI